MTAQQETTQEPRFISDMSMASRCILSSVHTALRFPVPDLRTSRPPGPMLLLLDFLRPAPIPPALPMSIVAFSFSEAFRDGDRPPPPMDFRVLRVAGNVTSPWDDIVVKCDCSPKTIKTVCCFLSSRKKVLWNYINATGTCTLKDAPGRGRATVRIRDTCINRGAISLVRACKVNKCKPHYSCCADFAKSHGDGVAGSLHCGAGICHLAGGFGRLVGTSVACTPFHTFSTPAPKNHSPLAKFGNREIRHSITTDSHDNSTSWVKPPDRQDGYRTDRAERARFPEAAS